MKKVLIVLSFILAAIASFSFKNGRLFTATVDTFINKQTVGSPTTLSVAKGGYRPDTALIISNVVFADTTAANFSRVAGYNGAIIQCTGGVYWVRQLNPNKWHNFILNTNTTYVKYTDTATMLTPYHASFYNASFDTTSRILTLAPITGSSPTLVTIPRGGTISGITTITPNRASGSNVQWFLPDNGANFAISLNTTDSLTKVHYSDTAALVAPYLRKTDTTTMLAPFVQYSDTANIVSNRLKISDTALMLSNRLKITDTSLMLSNRLKISDTSTMLSPYYRSYNPSGFITASSANTLTNKDISGLANTFTNIPTSALNASTISGVALGSNLFSLSTSYGLTGTNYNGSATVSNWKVDTTSGYLATWALLKKKIDSLGASGGTGTVTSVATNNGSGITGGTITSSGTIAADTLNLSTRLWRQKGIDSVVGLVGLKVNISDTSSMLSNYRRKTTVITNADLQNSTISGVALGLNLFGHTTSFGLTGTSYNGSATVNDWKVDTTSGAMATWALLKKKIDSVAAIGTGTGTVTSVATNNGSGISGGTITSTGTLVIDTLNLSTRLWRQKGVDSLNGLLALKLNISDTASMLSNRLKISDTATMLSARPLNNRFLDSILNIRVLANSKYTGGTVTNVTGTTNRISVANGTTTPSVDISSAYVGQTSITTLGTIGTGTWQGTSISTTYTDAKFSGSGTSGYIPKLTGTTSLGNSVIIEDAGNIGIGATPVTNFQLTASSGPTIAIKNTTSNTSLTRGNFQWYNSNTSTVAQINALATTDDKGTSLEFYTRPAAGDLTKNLDIGASGAIVATSTVKATRFIGNSGTDNTVDAVQSGGGSILSNLYRMEGKIQASNATIDATASVWNDNTNGSTVTYTLPSTSSLAGGLFMFIKTGTGNLTLSGTIIKRDGTSAGGSMTLASTDGLNMFWFNGTTWYQIQ